MTTDKAREAKKSLTGACDLGWGVGWAMAIRRGGAGAGQDRVFIDVKCYGLCSNKDGVPAKAWEHPRNTQQRTRLRRWGEGRGFQVCGQVEHQAEPSPVSTEYLLVSPWACRGGVESLACAQHRSL